MWIRSHTAIVAVVGICKRVVGLRDTHSTGKDIEERYLERMVRARVSRMERERVSVRVAVRVRVRVKVRVRVRVRMTTGVKVSVTLMTAATRGLPRRKTHDQAKGQ